MSLHEQQHPDTTITNMRNALFLNLGFAILEIIGGLITGSMAILADAIHDFGDSISLTLAWFLEKFSRKKPNNTFSYGYGRFSLLSALVTAIIIISGSFFIIIETIPKFWNPTRPNGWGMFGFSILGILVNGYAALKVLKGKNLNEKMLQWHMLEDTFGWMIVFLGSIFYLIKGYSWIDPVLALILSIVIIVNVFRHLRSTLKVFLQSTPENFDQDTFIKKAMCIDGVKDIHDLHVWSLDGNRHILSLHVVIDSYSQQNQAPHIKAAIKDLASHLGQYHATVELETIEEFCAGDKECLLRYGFEN